MAREEGRHSWEESRQRSLQAMVTARRVFFCSKEASCRAARELHTSTCNTGRCLHKFVCPIAGHACACGSANLTTICCLVLKYHCSSSSLLFVSISCALRGLRGGRHSLFFFWCWYLQPRHQSGCKDKKNCDVFISVSARRGVCVCVFRYLFCSVMFCSFLFCSVFS